MDFGLKGKNVFITGGSRGIGRAIAQAFAREGANTVITYRRESEENQSLISQMRDAGVKAAGYAVDVTDADGMAEAMKQTVQELGGLDVVVCNAGVIKDTLLLMMSPEDWQSVIDTNLSGAFNTIKPAIKPLLKNKGGSIITLSSIAGSRPGRGHANYAASKGGIEALTKALAAELASKKVRVNAVAPGMIETDMSQAVRDAAGDEILKSIPLKRYGSPDDIANAVLFLASPLSSYITGQTIHVDGGLS